MFQKTFSSLNLWQFDNLQSDGLIHYVSGRAGGRSVGEKGGLNLSYKVDDDPELVVENRLKLSTSLQINLDQLVFPQQTHTVNVKVVSSQTTENELIDTDAVITNSKEICISVMSADCVPVLLYDPTKKVIGAIHAGWKGTVGKIVSLTVMAMEKNYGCRPADLLAAIGPSIGPDIYEVGEEVISSVKKSFGKSEGLISGESGLGKGYFNLWEANRRQLLELGVPESSIEVAGICTYKNSETFFSARRSRNQAGRFAAGIMLK